MSKAYLFAAILLAGGIIGCIDAAEEDEELIEVLGIDDAYVTASKFLVDKFNDVSSVEQLIILIVGIRRPWE